MSRFFPQPQDDLTLRDIHMPPAPPWWPPAPGWWVVFGVVCVVLIAAWLFYRHMRRKRAIRERIFSEMEQVATRHPHDDAAYAASMHQFLRRVARRYADDARSTQGEHWKRTLALVPVDAATLDSLMTLDARMYQPHADFDRSRVHAAAQRWLHAALRYSKVMESGHA